MNNFCWSLKKQNPSENLRSFLIFLRRLSYFSKIMHRLIMCWINWEILTEYHEFCYRSDHSIFMHTPNLIKIQLNFFFHKKKNCWWYFQYFFILHSTLHASTVGSSRSVVQFSKTFIFMNSGIWNLFCLKKHTCIKFHQHNMLKIVLF